MFEKICKYLSFGSIAVLALYMAAMTVLEKFSGTEAAMRWGYHSVPFIVLWAVTAVSGLVFYVMRTECRHLATSGIHLAFVFILSGALITRIDGVQGALHLRVGSGPATEFMTEDMRTLSFPFSVSLEDFDIEYYPGTYAPTDYVSLLKIQDGTEETEFTVAMNRIARYRGYRFYQSGYDEDGLGSTLAVSHDPVGVPVTYTGYALLLLSMAGFFFQKDSRFRSVLSRISRKAAASVLFLCFVAAADAGAESGLPDETPDDRTAVSPKCLPEEIADKYGRMYIYYNDRICPVQTLARDFTMKLYGKASYRGMTPEQVLTGWIFFPDSWSETLPQDTGTSAKSLKKAREKQETAMLVCTAGILKIFPVQDDTGAVRWYSSVDRLPAGMEPDQWLFVRKVMSLAGESIVRKDFAEVGNIFAKVREYQEKTAAGLLPGDSRIAAERLYNSIERPKAVSMVCIVAGIILFIVYCMSSGFGRGLRYAGAGLSGAVFLYLTLVMGLRWYISAHVPMSDGFEVMLLLAWHTMMLGTFVQRKFPLILPFAFLLGGFALLVASIGESDPAIAYLMPVLSSPLLSVHVMTMMISYTLLGLVMLNGVMALVKYGRSRTGMADAADMSLAVLYPAVFFLVAGTFIGAVWANVSWGRYWAWDPKEVWALITILVYSFALHGRSLKVFSNPRFFHWFCVLAFLCVLVTYFGVNYFLGGLHSYS